MKRSGGSLKGGGVHRSPTSAERHKMNFLSGGGAGGGWLDSLKEKSKELVEASTPPNRARQQAMFFTVCDRPGCELPSLHRLCSTHIAKPSARGKRSEPRWLAVQCMHVQRFQIWNHCTSLQHSGTAARTRTPLPGACAVVPNVRSEPRRPDPGVQARHRGILSSDEDGRLASRRARKGQARGVDHGHDPRRA